MPEILANLISYLGDEAVRRFILFIFKTFTLAMSVFLSVGIVILFARVLKHRPRLRIADASDLPKLSEMPIELDKHLVRGKWEKILERIQAGAPENFILAVIEADSLIDTVLKEKGVAGKDMGERLKSIDKKRLNSLNELWEAHKLRNKIAHDPHFPITLDEVKKALRTYNKVLNELKLI